MIASTLRVCFRDYWTAFWSSSAGYAFGGAWYYQAAGAESPRVRVGEQTIGHTEGELRLKFLDVGENPVRGIERFKTIEEPPRSLEEDEIKKLLAESHGVHKAAILIGLHAGMRKGEIRHLIWPNVDLVKGVIRVGPVPCADCGGQWTPKTSRLRSGTCTQIGKRSGPQRSH